MRKGILITIIGILIIGIGYFGTEMFDFAKGVKEDIPKNIENFEKNKTVKLIESEKELKLDTLNADNYNVLFFHPTESEFNELLKKNGEESGLYEVDSDFGFYASKVYDSLSKTDLKVEFVTQRIIKYSTKNGIKYFDRLKNTEHPYGIIFNKINCDPKIEFGVMVDIGIIQSLNEYNKNCK
tara:strand:- start:44 stop:589 length:546 start_codon:yes stop_codon:yes gene_type:complete